MLAIREMIAWFTTTVYESSYAASSPAAEPAKDSTAAKAAEPSAALASDSNSPQPFSDWQLDEYEWVQVAAELNAGGQY